MWPELKYGLIILGCFGVVGAMATLSFFTIVGFLFRVPDAPPAKLGYKGDWRAHSVFGNEYHSLPPATKLWDDDWGWTTKVVRTRTGSTHATKYYLARMGGAEWQSNFRVITNRGDTPMGAQTYTHIDFDYTDPTNGTYHLSWSRRGKHDPSFLRFDTNYRTYQLQLHGSSNDVTPQLHISGVEGVQPEH